MKILMINVVCGIRSTGRICINLATVLEAQGHEVKIAYGREEVPEQFQKYTVRIGTNLDVKVHGVKARLFDACGFGSKNATERFIAWVKDYDPDVIHLHNLHGYYINIEVLFNYLKTSGKRIIWTLHDCWAFTGHSALCDGIGCERWENGCYECPNMKEYPSSYVDRSIRNWQRKKRVLSNIPNMTIITPSHWLEGLVKRSFLKNYPVKVIHNGIDTKLFYPIHDDFREVYGLTDKIIILGVASNWNSLKGYNDYIEVSEKLGEPYRVVLVGLTNDQKESLPSNIVGIEKTNSIKELRSIYSSADFFVNLSYCETYPINNLEAIACGVSVITYDTGGSPESAQNGIVVPRGDIDGVVEAIKSYKKMESTFEIEKIDRKEAVYNYLDSAYRGGGYWAIKRTLGLVGKYVILGVASTWNEMKGLDDFEYLAANLNSNYQVILLGISEKERSLIKSNIIGLEATNNYEELRKIYSVADVYVNLSKTESFGMTNIEAALCGTSVISYNTGGCAESVEMANGLIVPKGKIEEIIRFIEHPDAGAYEQDKKSIMSKREMENRYVKFIVTGDKDDLSDGGIKNAISHDC